MIILLSVTVSIMIGLLLSISYGWYAYANAETNIKTTTKKDAATVVFAQTEFITATINTPIYDDDRYRYANKNSFTVTFGENLKNYEIGLEIILSDIEISDELRIENYKYELLENKKVIANGNFSELNDINNIDDFNKNYTIHGGFLTFYAKNPHTLKV